MSHTLIVIGLLGLILITALFKSGRFHDLYMAMELSA